MQLSRRDLLRYVGASAMGLGLSRLHLDRFERVLADSSSPPVIWLSGAACTGCSVSLLNAANPTIDQVLLNTISLNFHPNLMSAAGDLAVAAAESASAAGGYVLVVEGAVPTGDGGRYCYVWDKDGSSVTMAQAVTNLAANAAHVVAVGTCAAYGGIPGAYAAAGAMGVGQFLGRPVVNIPGCPAHPDWIVGSLVRLLTGDPPALDEHGRPLVYFPRKPIHERCPREDDVPEAKRFGQDGFCLEELGCKGKRTHADCDIRRWNDGQSWCIGVNGLCIGCTEPNFPDFPLHSGAEDDDDRRGHSPSTVGASPDSGWCATGRWQSFRAVYEHPDGWHNIRYADLMINSAPDPTRSVCVRYDAQRHLACLHGPLSAQWLDAKAEEPGSPVVLRHGWAKVNLAELDVVADGSTLAVTWPIAFTARSSGASNNIYLSAEDIAGNRDGWNDHGGWTINRVPLLIPPQLNEQAVPAGDKLWFDPKYRDRDGRDSLGECYLLFSDGAPGSSSDGRIRDAVYLRYDHVLGRLSVRDTDDQAWIPLNGEEPQTSFLMEHELVTVYGPGSRVFNANAQTLTTEWRLAFKPGFRGRRKVYMRAVDRLGAASGGDTGWKWKGWIEIN